LQNTYLRTGIKTIGPLASLKLLILESFNSIGTMDLTNAKPLYGEGNVSDKIAEILKEDYEGK